MRRRSALALVATFDLKCSRYSSVPPLRSWANVFEYGLAAPRSSARPDHPGLSCSDAASTAGASTLVPGSAGRNRCSLMLAFRSRRCSPPSCNRRPVCVRREPAATGVNLHGSAITASYGSSPSGPADSLSLFAARDRSHGRSPCLVFYNVLICACWVAAALHQIRYPSR